MLHLFQQGLGYSALNSARSTLSTFLTKDGTPVGSHPHVVRFMKGVFNVRPALPRNKVVWDSNLVLAYLRTIWPLQQVSLKDLTFKTIMLLLLLSSQRGQTIHLFQLNNMSVTQEGVSVRIGDLLRHTKPGRHLDELFYPAYEPDDKLCVVQTLQEYIRRTTPLRQTPKLLISYIRPYGAVSRATITRWAKTILVLIIIRSGVDMTIFTPHSCRLAASSAALLCRVPLATLLSTAGWSNARTFGSFYNKPVCDRGVLARSLLDRAQ